MQHKQPGVRVLRLDLLAKNAGVFFYWPKTNGQRLSYQALSLRKNAFACKARYWALAGGAKHKANSSSILVSDMSTIRIKVFILLAAIAPVSAYAYIDPSSSLLIIQGALTFFGAIIIFIKNPIQTIKGWLQKLKKKNDA